MSKTQDKQTGRYAGYADYRYGPARKPTLAPIWKGSKRRHRVDVVMDLLRDWRMSPFEHEGATRAGIRSALCLDGHGWARSDMTAAEVIAEALHRMGAERPTWDQGQREYSLARDTCLRCGGTIPEEFQVGERRQGFCSDICARAMISERNLRVMSRETQAYQDAQDTIRRAGHKPIACEACGKTFRPLFADGKFCSRVCSSDNQRMVSERVCLHCDKQFTPTTVYGGRGLFCSIACKQAHGSTVAIKKNCLVCGSTFTAKTKIAETCGKLCQRLSYQIKQAKLPQRINPPLFDWMMMEQGTRLTGEARIAA